MDIFPWVFLGALLALCVIPMLLMSKRNKKNKPDDTPDDKRGSGSAQL